MKDQSPPCSQSQDRPLLPIGAHPASDSTSKASQDDQSTLVTSVPEIVAVKDHIEISVPDSDVFYHEQNNIPGICVKTVDEPMTSWTPIKISRSRMRVADSNSSDDDIPIDDWLMLDYQVVNGAPGFVIETKDDTFWVPIAHRTRSATCAHLKSTNT